MVAFNFLDPVDFREYDGVGRPVVDVDLHPSDGSAPFGFQMVFDTGTPFTSLPADIASTLGVPLLGLQMKTGRGAGGCYDYYPIDSLRISLVHPNGTSLILSCPVHFVPNLNDRGYGLLGLHGVIDTVHFGVCGVHSDKFYWGRHDRGCA